MARLGRLETAALAESLFLVVRCVLEHHVHSFHDGNYTHSRCQCLDYFGMRAFAHSPWRLAFYLSPPATENMDCHWRCGAGIAMMFMSQLQLGDPNFLLGVGIALFVPLAGATQWNLTHLSQKSGVSIDLVPSVLLGAIISCILTLPMAWPLQANAHDISLLALLGIVQLAIPCTLSVICARVLKAPEVSLLALLEVIFGIALAWWGANEEPQLSVLIGGGLVIAALFANEWFGWRQRNV